MPYLAIHNTEDPTVPYQNALDTKTYLDTMSVVNDLYAIAGAEHTPDPFTTAGRDNGIMFDDMVGFMVRRMSGSACGIFDGDDVFDVSQRSGAGNGGRSAGMGWYAAMGMASLPLVNSRF